MEKANLFELSWSWYEDYSPYLLIHDNKTEEEFNADIKSLFRKYSSEFLDAKEKEGGLIQSPDLVHFVYLKMLELGYKFVNPISKGFWGGYILEGDDDEKEIAEYMGNDNYDRALALRDTD